MDNQNLGLERVEDDAWDDARLDRRPCANGCDRPMVGCHSICSRCVEAKYQARLARELGT